MVEIVLVGIRVTARRVIQSVTQNCINLGAPGRHTASCQGYVRIW